MTARGHGRVHIILVATQCNLRHIYGSVDLATMNLAMADLSHATPEGLLLAAVAIGMAVTILIKAAVRMIRG